MTAIIPYLIEPKIKEISEILLQQKQTLSQIEQQQQELHIKFQDLLTLDVEEMDKLATDQALLSSQMIEVEVNIANLESILLGLR